MKTVFEQYKTEFFKGGVAVAVALLVGALVIAPLYADIDKTEKRIEEARVSLERQKIFLPEYVEVQDQAKPGLEADFPVPDAVPVQIRDISRLPSLVEQAAANSGMSALDVVISPGSLRGGGGRLQMQAVVSGGEDGFQRFYTALAALGEVSGVSRMEVQSVPGTLEFLVEFWVHIEEKAG
jgi:hypothetical protein